MTTEMTKCDNFNIRLYKERRKNLGTEQNSEEISKIVFSEEVLGLANKSSFPWTDHIDDSGKKNPLFAGENSKYLLKSRTSSFLDDMFTNCPRQMAHLYSLQVDLGSISHENYMHPVLLALLLDKQEQHHC